MKKILVGFFAFTVALALAMPASAISWPFHRHKHAKAQTSGEAHEQNAKKKGATEGKKKGQKGVNPGHANK